MQQFNWGAFDVISNLGYGHCGAVYEAIFQGEKVALKLGDIWQRPELEREMLNEVETYIYLGMLQGHAIPKLKGCGYTVRQEVCF